MLMYSIGLLFVLGTDEYFLLMYFQNIAFNISLNLIIC